MFHPFKTSPERGDSVAYLSPAFSAQVVEEMTGMVISLPVATVKVLVGILVAATSVVEHPASFREVTTRGDDRDQAIIGWLRDRAVALADIKPTSRSEDLKPLHKILHGIRVVGVGEATHGTREFVQMRHRLFKFLVEEMGFTTLAVEFSASDAFLLNDYVVHGPTSRDQVLACLRKSWISDTEEMRAVVDWMREHNAKASTLEKVRFVGIDPQGNARAIDNVKDYFAEVAPDRIAQSAELFRVLAAEDSHALAFAPTKVAPEHRARLYKLISYVVLNRSRLVRRSSVEKWERALGDLKLLTQFAEFNSSGPLDDVGTRDGYMAENFLDMVARENPNARFVVWAHNAHVCKRGGGAFPALGSFLQSVFGEEYYAFGFAFDSGSFRAQLPQVQPPKIDIFHLESAPTGTIDWYMARAGIANYLVDLRSAPTDTRVADWLKTARNLHWVGAFFSEKPSATSSGRSFILRRDFDGMIFLTKSTATQTDRSRVP